MSDKKKKGTPPAVSKSEGIDAAGATEVDEAKKRDLNERLTRLRQKCENLAKENDELVKAQISNTQDKRDIVEFLNLKLQEQGQQVVTLDKRVTLLEYEKEQLIAKYDAEIKEMQTHFKQEFDQKTSELSHYKGELSQLTDFKSKKDEYSDQIKDLKNLVEAKEAEYKESVHAIEKKVLQDKTQLKKEMLQKVHEAVSNFRKVADQQMAETTKRAIIENTAITNQLQKMSEKTLELISENTELQEQIARLKAENSLMRSAEKEYAKRNVSHQKVIQMLVEKLQQTDKMLEIAYDTGVMDDVNDKVLADLFNNEASPQVREELKAFKEFTSELSEKIDLYKEVLERMSDLISLHAEKFFKTDREMVWKDLLYWIDKYQAIEDPDKPPRLEVFSEEGSSDHQNLTAIRDQLRTMSPSARPSIIMKGNPHVGKKLSVEPSTNGLGSEDNDYIQRPSIITAMPFNAKRCSKKTSNFGIKPDYSRNFFISDSQPNYAKKLSKTSAQVPALPILGMSIFHGHVTTERASKPQPNVVSVLASDTQKQQQPSTQEDGHYPDLVKEGEKVEQLVGVQE